MKMRVVCLLIGLGVCLLSGCGEQKEEIQSKSSVETDETLEDFYRAATSLSASEVEEYAENIKKNILESDWPAIAEKINYPIILKGEEINDATAFLAMDIDNQLSEEFISSIEAESCRQMFCNYQGISMGGAGQIWIGSIVDEKGTKLRIIAINGLLVELTDEKIYEQFYEQTYGGISSEIIDERLADRGQYYHTSAYYEEITYYWENIRGVTDISNLIEPLYFTDMKYYTEEDFANDTPVAIHLAKNEIYARHGYIFQNEDLNNYFMGCAWYTPLYTAEEFDYSVFNDYEIKNMELLAKLDSGSDLTSSPTESVAQEKLTVEEAWELMKETYSFLETAEMEEIRYDENGNFQVVIGRFYHPFSDEEVDRFIESLVFFNGEEDSCYLFGHHYVYYEEDEKTVYATQTKGWYEVDFNTGEVSRW